MEQEIKNIIKNIENRTKILFLVDEIRSIGVNPFKVKELFKENKEEKLSIIFEHMKDFNIKLNDFEEYLKKDQKKIKTNPSSKERLKELRKDIKKEVIIKNIIDLNIKPEEFFNKNTKDENVDLGILLLINNKIKKLNTSYNEVESYYNRNKLKIEKRKENNFNIVENEKKIKKGMRNGL